MNTKNKIVISIVCLLGFSSGFFVVYEYLSPISYVSSIKETASAIGSQIDIQRMETAKESKEPAKDTNSKKNEGTKNKKTDCPLPKKEYPDYTYLDVGQTVAIPDKTYIPSDLVLLDKSITTTTNCLKKDAAQAITELISAAKKDNYDIKVSSGFRSYSTQKIILENNIKNGNKNATRLIAKPGYSEHQLGVAVDLTGASIKNISAAAKFKNSVEDRWLEIHAREYGFVESYPEDKEDITGYMNEDWHYRYVGIDNAKEIIENKQTINEFLKTRKEAELQNKITQ